MHFEISGKVCDYQKVSNGSGFLLFSFISLSETAEQVLRHLKIIQHVAVKRAAFLIFWLKITQDLNILL